MARSTGIRDAAAGPGRPARCPDSDSDSGPGSARRVTGRRRRLRLRPAASVRAVADDDVRAGVAGVIGAAGLSAAVQHVAAPHVEEPTVGLVAGAGGHRLSS